MPGLTGIIKLRKETVLNLDLFQKMVETITYRSWYQRDIYVDANDKFAIGRIHLGIINADAQPYTKKKGGIKVFLHGELFNDEALGTNQCQYIYKLYEKHGEAFVKELNGSYNIILIDEEAEKILIINDRIASRPFFYAVSDEHFVFGPELKSLLVNPSLKRQIDLTTVAGFLAAGHFLNGAPYLKGLSKLENASLLTIQPGSFTIKKYWDFTLSDDLPDRGRKFYAEALIALIQQAIRRHTSTPHRYGVLLSGGYDSRGILGGYLALHPTRPIETITWGDEPDTPRSDCAVARQLAERLQLNHSFYRLRPEFLPQSLDAFIYLHEGQTDALLNYPEGLQLFKRIREDQRVDIILRGDECFGFSQPAYESAIVFEKLGIRSLDHSAAYRQLLKSEFLVDLTSRLSQTLTGLERRCVSTNPSNRVNYFYFDQRVIHYLNPLNYLKSTEVEVRTPYFDTDLLEFLKTVPCKYQFGKQLYRQIIVQTYPGLFNEIAELPNLPKFDNSVCQFLSARLFQQVNSAKFFDISEYVDPAVSRNFLIHSPSMAKQQSPWQRIVRHARGRLVKNPTLYQSFQKLYRMNRLYKINNEVPFTKAIVRLTVIKLFCERFQVSL